MTRLFVAAAVFLVLLSGVTVALASAAGHALPSPGEIAYSAPHGDSRDIFLVDVGTHRRVRLTFGADDDDVPRWSPDGQRLAFLSGRGTNVDVYVVGADGGLPTRLTTTQDFKVTPEWSPDGGEIVFQGTLTDGVARGISVLNVTTRAITVLQPAETGVGMRPSWSPDGRRLAFISAQSLRLTLFILPGAGVGATDSYNAGIASASLAWSPDSHWLIYSVAGPELNDGYVLYALEVASGHHLVLTDRPGALWSLTWSPDARKLAVVSNIGNGGVLSLLDVGCLQTGQPCSRRLVPISQGSILPGSPTWSPDGTRLAFTRHSPATGLSELDVVEADCAGAPTSCAARTFRLVDDGTSPDWRPTVP